eukprot:scaffold2088_cov399-Prasinococcus_capsulatus_cf.AAC.12
MFSRRRITGLGQPVTQGELASGALKQSSWCGRAIGRSFRTRWCLTISMPDTYPRAECRAAPGDRAHIYQRCSVTVAT